MNRNLLLEKKKYIQESWQFVDITLPKFNIAPENKPSQ